jgi:hypothetical protein
MHSNRIMRYEGLLSFILIQIQIQKCASENMKKGWIVGFVKKETSYVID